MSTNIVYKIKKCLVKSGKVTTAFIIVLPRFGKDATKVW